MAIGETIREYRKKRNLTQKQLGELSGTSESTIKQYELGKRQPRIEQLKRLLKPWVLLNGILCME
ncbi:MAG: helix-turn-helix domain-containing protein [Blautia sp.]